MNFISKIFGKAGKEAVRPLAEMPLGKLKPASVDDKRPRATLAVDVLAEGLLE